MRTNARPLPAAALLLAASAATLSGCASPGLCQQAKIVIVTYEPGAPTAVMAESDKTIRLSLKNKDFVEWVSPDGLVYVKFTKESPFDGPPKHEKKVLKSGTPKRGSEGRTFEYTAELWLDPEGKKRVGIDPRIEVMP
jgi:hypothetical protein